MLDNGKMIKKMDMVKWIGLIYHSDIKDNGQIISNTDGEIIFICRVEVLIN